MTLFFANTGIPMIFPQVFLMLVALAPVIIIESLVIGKSLRLPLKSTGAGVAVANLWTTLIGIPIAWGLMLALEILSTGGSALGITTPVQMLTAVTLQAAWLIPYEEHMFWMIPTAATVLLFPSFVVSILIEARVLRRRWSEIEAATVRRAVVRANICSYLILFIIGVLGTISAIERHGKVLPSNADSTSQ